MKHDISALRRQLVLGAAATPLALWAPAVEAAPEVEGVTLDESAMVGGRKLFLNGYGVRKRSYYKADVTALYLPERTSSVEQIMKLDGPRRVQLNVLREFSSGTISRMFISDFKQVATDEEFKSLIDVIAKIGATYATVKKVSKGDVVNLDWMPGKGWVTFINGKQVAAEGYAEGNINNELAYQIYLRMYISQHAPADLRAALLGKRSPEA